VPRPPKLRVVCGRPVATHFKPRGVRLCDLEEVVIGLDALEALRWVDLEGLSQEEAGEHMGVSRGTIGRLVEGARRAITDALVTGKALRLEGGPIVEGPGMGPGRRRRRSCRGGREQ
jgi:predicted DNA-binding protein (UPF0251 family)